MIKISSVLLYLLIFLFISCTSTANTDLPTYNRKDWPHWSKVKGSCFNTRHKILNDRSTKDVVVKYNKTNCSVQEGLWDDYYYPEVLTAPSDIDIDHLVPLRHAHATGGHDWTRKEKRAFANDPENLVVTNKKYNRQKGPKSIAEWLPINFKYACKYYFDWMKIKKKYRLNISQEEVNAIDYEKCP